MVQRRNFQQKKDLYISPQLFCALAKGKPRVRYNPYKNEIFALGLLLLEIGLLCSIQQIYDFEKKSFDKYVFLLLLDNFMEIYGANDLLRELLIKMLEFDESLWMDSLELTQYQIKLQSLLQGQGVPIKEEINSSDKREVPSHSGLKRELDNEGNEAEVKEGWEEWENETDGQSLLKIHSKIQQKRKKRNLGRSSLESKENAMRNT